MRLIDADTLLAEYDRVHIGPPGGARKLIEDAPTIKPRNGKWIVTSKFKDCYYAKCNQCKVTQVFYYNKPLTNFCPNCGAFMRGE